LNPLAPFQGPQHNSFVEHVLPSFHEKCNPSFSDKLVVAKKKDPMLLLVSCFQLTRL
jgi:hypothetical protein